MGFNVNCIVNFLCPLYGRRTNRDCPVLSHLGMAIRRSDPVERREVNSKVNVNFRRTGLGGPRTPSFAYLKERDLKK
jgi:hypothetical protein